MTAQLGLSKGVWSTGLATLISNDGVEGGQYTSWAGSIAREHGEWLTALEWGWAQSDLAGAEGQTFQLGSSRLVGDHGLIGAGIRYSEQDVAFNLVGGSYRDIQAGLSLFLETGLRF